MEGEGRCAYRTSGSFFSMIKTRRRYCASPWPLQTLCFAPARAAAPRERVCPGRRRAALAPGRLPGGCRAALAGDAEAAAGLKSGCQLPRGTMAPLGDNGGQRRCFQGWFYMHTCDLCLKWLYGKHPCPEALLSNAAIWGACLICPFSPPLFFSFLLFATCLRRGHVQITRWCRALSNRLIELFSNG